jgi:NADH-quinone oxidoreductase subunit C
MAMPEESKGPEAISSATEGAKTPVEKAPASPEAAQVKPDVASSVPSAEPAKTATPASQKPGAAAKPVPPPAAKPAAPPKPEGPKPLPWESALVSSLRSQYGTGVREASTYVGQKYLVVDSSIVYEVLLKMRADELFDYCVDITVVHYPKREEQFDLIYVLYSFHHNERVRVKTLIKDGGRPRSAVSIWPTANWLEREVFDMFGIEFEGHPDLKRILLPDGWTGHPLRKDYPILQQDKEWVQINLGIESGQ